MPALVSAGLFVGASVTPQAASASCSPPSIGLTASQNPVASNGNFTYTISLNNPTVPVRVCDMTDGAHPHLVCYWDTQSVPITGVSVTDTLPSGVTFDSANASAGFSCGLSGNTVSCSNGNATMTAGASIAISVTAPTLTSSNSISLSDTATANPGNVSASVQTTILPPPLPDLVVTSFTGSPTVQRGGQATYTVTVANTGQAPANGVGALVNGGSQLFSVHSSSGSADFGSTPGCMSAPERESLMAWCPGITWGPTLAPGATLTATVLVDVDSATTPGMYTFTATVNPLQHVTESNYNNNTAPTVTTFVY